MNGLKVEQEYDIGDVSQWTEDQRVTRAQRCVNDFNGVDFYGSVLTMALNDATRRNIIKTIGFRPFE